MASAAHLELARLNARNVAKHTASLLGAEAGDHVDDGDG